MCACVSVCFQSSDEPLIIDGEGFPEDKEVKVEFGKLLGPEAGGITCERISDTQVKLSLVDGYKWAASGGPLFVTKVLFGETEVQIH